MDTRQVDPTLGASEDPDSSPRPPEPRPLPLPPPPAPLAPAARGARPGLGWRGALVAVMAGAVGAGAVVVPAQLADDATSSAVDALATETRETPEPGADTAESIASPVGAIARQVGPSVARVDATTPNGQGAGSAVVYDADGILVTNAHVVDGATRVTVTLPDGDRTPATVVGTDPSSDLAVLRIDSTLPVPAWGDDDVDPAVGDPVVAIGSPFGLDGSVTAGIVSALDRTVTAGPGASLVDLLQTDAAINPGNSGGALVDGAARVIGVNTAIVSRGGGNDGIGFAIPAATVHRVVEQLLEHGSVQHVELGIAGQTVDPDVAALYGLGVQAGALVAEVRPDGPADRAGLERGDIVTAIDGDPVRSISDLAGRVQQYEPGDRVTLQVVRQGDRREVVVELVARADDE